MKASRFSEEQIIAILREQEAGQRTADVCRRHGVSEATFYKWKSKYGDMSATSLRHSHVKSSTMQRMRKRRPSTGASDTKFSDQRWFGPSGGDHRRACF